MICRWCIVITGSYTSLECSYSLLKHRIRSLPTSEVLLVRNLTQLTDATNHKIHLINISTRPIIQGPIGDLIFCSNRMQPTLLQLHSIQLQSLRFRNLQIISLTGNSSTKQTTTSRRVLRTVNNNAATSCIGLRMSYTLQSFFTT